MRIALFLVFAGIFSYMDVGGIRAWSAVNPQMNSYYLALNAGHPLYGYRGDVNDLRDRDKIDPTKLVPYFEDMQNDAGILISMSWLRLIFDRLGVLKDYVLNDYQLPFFAFVAMLAFSATLMLVRLPLAAAILAHIPLLRVTLDFSGALFTDPRRVEFFGLAILGVYALVVVCARPRKGTVAFIVTTTLFVAWLNLCRQGLITQMFVLDTLLIAYFAARALARRLLKSGYRKKPAAIEVRKALALSLGLPVVIAYTVAVSAVLSICYGLPYSSAYLPSHGSGHSLYVSLGYAANPFNLAWDDDVFQVNYMTFSDHHFGFTYPEWSEVTEPALSREYERAVAEDPTVFLRNVVEKIPLAHRYLIDDRILQIFPLDLVYQFREPQRVAYYTVLATIGVLAAIALLPGWRWLWGALFPMLAVLATSVLPALLISPGYLLGFMGALYSVYFAWLGVCACALVFKGCRPFGSGRAANRFAALLFAAVAAGLVVAALYVGFRERYNAHQDARLLSENPYEVMIEKGYRFAESFNRLTLADQRRAIERLLTMHPKSDRVEVFCRPDREIYSKLGPESTELQASVCAFVLEEPWRKNFRVAMVVNYFSDRWREVLPRSDQGPVGSNVTLGSIEPCPEQPRRVAKYWWDRPRQHLERCVYNRFANANWRGKFYINLFPVGKQFTRGADVLVASAQEIMGSPEHSQFSFFEHDVGATRLERYDWRRLTTEDAGPERR